MRGMNGERVSGKSMPTAGFDEIKYMLTLTNSQIKNISRK